MTTIKILNDFDEAIEYLSGIEMFNGLWTIGKSETILIENKIYAMDIMAELDYCGYDFDEI